MKLFKRTLWNCGDARLISRLPQVHVNHSKFVPTGSPEVYDMYTMFDSLQLELSTKGSAFRFSWGRQATVAKGLQESLTWFFNNKDLFYYEENILYFNSKYDNLKTGIYSGDKTHQFLEIIPIIVERGYNRGEGVLMSINNMETSVAITLNEFLELTSIISTIDFSSEALLLFNMASKFGGVDLIESERS